MLIGLEVIQEVLAEVYLFVMLTTGLVEYEVLGLSMKEKQKTILDSVQYINQLRQVAGDIIILYVAHHRSQAHLDRNYVQNFVHLMTGSLLKDLEVAGSPLRLRKKIKIYCHLKLIYELEICGVK